MSSPHDTQLRDAPCPHVTTRPASRCHCLDTTDPAHALLIEAAVALQQARAYRELSAHEQRFVLAVAACPPASEPMAHRPAPPPPRISRFAATLNLFPTHHEGRMYPTPLGQWRPVLELSGKLHCCRIDYADRVHPGESRAVQVCLLSPVHAPLPQLMPLWELKIVGNLSQPHDLRA